MIIYVGDCEFGQVGPSVWGIDSLGFDNLVEQYKGRTDKLDDYIRSLSISGVHPTYTGLAARHISNDNDPALTTVTIEYAGFASGKPRPPLYRSGISLQTVQSSVTLQNAGKCSVEAQFYAPVGEWEWYQVGAEPDPDTPLYSGVKTKEKNLVNNLIRFHVQDDSGATVTSAALSDVAAALNGLQNVLLIQEYSYEPVVANYIWHCRCSTLKTLIGV